MQTRLTCQLQALRLSDLQHLARQSPCTLLEHASSLKPKSSFAVRVASAQSWSPLFSARRLLCCSGLHVLGRFAWSAHHFQRFPSPIGCSI